MSRALHRSTPALAVLALALLSAHAACSSSSADAVDAGTTSAGDAAVAPLDAAGP
ncbi:MAG: hypothetical protein JWP97_2258, partial [Labilithrix sp.]|nr:hypothetical protein [Labilithrix sp.]